jgi:nucleotide-binding universal stress UspA family protein
MKCHLLSVGKGNAKLEVALSEAKQILSEAGYEVSSEMRDGEPDKVIGEVVAQAHIDLLVMGAYGHSKIRHLIVGSTTTAMIRTVKIPVLLFR